MRQEWTPRPSLAPRIARCAAAALLVLGAGCSDPDEPAAEPELRCNGRIELCERRFGDVAFPATHNSHASEASGLKAFVSNQTRTLAEQLDDGIRAFLIDVHDQDGVSYLCHGACQFGKLAHAEALATFLRFLTDHPREVVTLIYEDRVPSERFSADYEAAGLTALAYRHAGGAWPTLAELIGANTRLIVTAQEAGPPPAWLHNIWSLAWDTPYSFKSIDDFTCDENRGSRSNALFLLNHWVGDDNGLPSPDAAENVNAAEVLSARATQCQTESGRLPNFVAVDFYEKGALFEVVDRLNGF